MATPFIGVFQSMALDILLYALIVVVVGGPGSVLGTLIGALIIGIVDAFGKAFFPDFAMFTMYLVLIIMLLIKPSGILGRSRNVEGTGSEVQPSSMPSSIRRGPACSNTARMLVCLLAFIVLPPLLPRYLQSMITKILIFSIFALSLNLIWGYTGLISLGHATYFGVGRIHFHDHDRALGDWEFLGGDFDCRDCCRASGGDLRDHCTPRVWPLLFARDPCLGPTRVLHFHGMALRDRG